MPRRSAKQGSFLYFIFLPAMFTFEELRNALTHALKVRRDS